MTKDNCGLYLRYLDSSFSTACALSLSAKSTRIRSLNICKASLFLPSSRHFIHLYTVYGNVISSALRIAYKKIIQNSEDKVNESILV